MTDKTYEMLWDCTHCGTKKLLGLTHRHCPNCGGEQAANARYFPADAEKVAVQDHVYAGADIQCPFCQNYNGRQAKHCGNCGGPLEGGKDVQRRADQVVGAGVAYAGQSVEHAQRELAGQGAPPVPPPKKGFSTLTMAGAAIAVVVGALVLCALVAVFWKKEAAMSVAGHSWKREIKVEHFGPVSESEWCDRMPSGASSVSRHKEVRSHNKVADGQDCKTRKVDNGNGTFTEKQECTTKYKEEPVYDDKCDFKIDKWSTARTEAATGAAVTDEPRWPEVKLGKAGSCIGCEREGEHTEKYTVVFRDQAKEEYRCDFPQAKWATFKAASKWKGDVRRMTSTLDCDSLAAAK